mgnify:CR=1 FL=1
MYCIWEKSLALWCDIRTKMLQVAFAAPKAKQAKQSESITRLKRQFNRRGKSGELCDDELVKVVIREMSKCEVQL